MNWEAICFIAIMVGGIWAMAWIAVTAIKHDKKNE